MAGVLSSDGLVPWPIAGGPCMPPQEPVKIGKNAWRLKGMPCWKGQAVAVPQIITPSNDFLACFVMIQQADQAPQMLQQRIAALSTILYHSSEDKPSVMDRCTLPKQLWQLPIDLTALAVCFASHLPTNGVAVIPGIANLDPGSKIHNWHEADVGFESPGGGVLLDDFVLKVSHPRVLQIKEIAFYLVVLPPSWIDGLLGAQQPGPNPSLAPTP